MEGAEGRESLARKVAKYNPLAVPILRCLAFVTRRRACGCGLP